MFVFNWSNFNVRADNLLSNHDRIKTNELERETEACRGREEEEKTMHLKFVLRQLQLHAACRAWHTREQETHISRTRLAASSTRFRQFPLRLRYAQCLCISRTQRSRVFRRQARSASLSVTLCVDRLRTAALFDALSLRRRAAAFNAHKLSSGPLRIFANESPFHWMVWKERKKPPQRRKLSLNRIGSVMRLIFRRSFSTSFFFFLDLFFSFLPLRLPLFKPRKIYNVFVFTSF